MKNKQTEASFALLRAGLWEKEVRLLPYGEVDYNEIMRLAEEQSVVGLVAAGMEHVSDTKIPKQDLLQFIGQTLQIEEQNKAMNYFIGVLVDKMRNEGIYTLLLKGQGIAQCYERPLWRSCGDVDFFLSDENYAKAKSFLTPLAERVEKEYFREKHLGMNIDPWVVELHGSLYCGLSSRIEKELDYVYRDTFLGGNIRSWNNENVQVHLLTPENDSFYVFTHILQHFYKGGIGLRQICDWCRLLWRYRSELCVSLLEKRICKAGLITEWRAFAAFAVDYLGMPVEAMPLFHESETQNHILHRKAVMIKDFVLEVGNMGHNRDKSYFEKYPYVIRKTISFNRRCRDLVRHAKIFPKDSVRIFPSIMLHGIISAFRGE